MALTEQRVLASVNHNKLADALEVCWADQVLRDGEVIASTAHRCAYSREQKVLFEVDLGVDAAVYVAAAGW
jgi:hypothetical protein